MNSLVKLIVGIILTVVVLFGIAIWAAFQDVPGAGNEGISWIMLILVIAGGICGLIAWIQGKDS